jgi:hypothetical protein
LSEAVAVIAKPAATVALSDGVVMPTLGGVLSRLAAPRRAV